LEVDERVKAVLKGWGIERLYPPQAEALPLALAGENLVLAIPTASGKSLIAYLALVKAALAGRPGIYLVPLRALAAEKIEELRAFEALGLTVKVATGELDESDAEIQGADIVVATSEKADSLMRHRSGWMDAMGVVVADEVHLMHDMSRGPTIEVLLAKVRMTNPKAQVIALSATIQNAQEIAEWLDAKLVQSEFRPVELKEGVSEGTSILFADRTRKMLLAGGEPVEALVTDSLRAGGQCLVFVNSRRSAAAQADRLRDAVRPLLTKQELAGLAKAAASVRAGEHTELHDRLGRCVEDGVAFHHAGLGHKQRAAVERAFKGRLVKTIVATPTLAAGVNLPAKRVIVRDMRRYDSNLGQVPIPVLEVKQMCGRAGRPRYDKEGEAVLIARTENEVEALMEHYVYADPERIFSKLGTEPALRVHLLASIATGYVRGEGDLAEFLGATFLSHQTNGWDLDGPVEDVLEFLDDHGLIGRAGPDLAATALGTRVSELYIDPLTAVRFMEALDLVAKRRLTDRSWLHLISAVPDAKALYMRESEWGWVQDLVEREKDTFLVDKVERLTEDEDFLSQVKTAEVLEWWVSEYSMDAICTKFDVGPGDVRNRVDTARWLLYALREVARASDMGPLPEVGPLARRVVAGVKPELLPLVAFRGVGRVRARSLWGHRVRAAHDVRDAKEGQLARIPLIGPRLAKDMKRQAGGQPPGTAPPAPTDGGGEDDLPAHAPARGPKEPPRAGAKRTKKPAPRARRQRSLGEWRP
jgi:helicase